MTDKTCKHCGYENRAQANFCRECGHKVAEVCDCWLRKTRYNCGMDECPDWLSYVRETYEQKLKS
jgi:hypothetical protein